ncbi:MBL fold metallo-hydrolase [Gloeocapsa sp. PCC 73106]|uniref:MBL fold metallo-hydrolase n=1 Tax=Gloeocapsa sp. PCC 73106 TaxID=102232 RepID=UPI0002ABEFAE|nr:MBL fold metallo-hydrolase [Gloeocapsa sp. PCC 73106]ELR98908.1 Zn-dependent hydrolase, glyoxylase [Gloeocapsa sp. PCC 73106]
MAKLEQKRKYNIGGDFYVDETCIDCDTCRWMTPEVFTRIDEKSAVFHQPNNQKEKIRALQALLSCPTASIGTVNKPTEIKSVQESFPIPITENVYHCGYHSVKSYGAASYLLVRPEGNVLIDSPRFTGPIVKQIEAKGGIRYLYLTHRDDVADHQKFQQHFNCDRILHQDDVTSDTEMVEIKLSGQEPIAIAPDLLIIPVPGHSKGHTVLLYNNRVLFTGDHLAWLPELEHLGAFREFCWYSWTELVNSMQKLAQYDFEWVLPGHGQRFHGTLPEVRQQMQKCLAMIDL